MMKLREPKNRPRPSSGTISPVTDIQAGKARLPKASRVTESAIAAQTNVCPPSRSGSNAKERMASRAKIPPNAMTISLRRPNRSTRNAPGKSSKAALRLESELIRPTCARVAPNAKIYKTKYVITILSLAEANRPSKKNQYKLCLIRASSDRAHSPPQVNSRKARRARERRTEK